MGKIQSDFKEVSVAFQRRGEEELLDIRGGVRESSGERQTVFIIGNVKI